MTVKELIQVLSRIEDQETRVMVKGYERGVEDISNNTPAIVNVALNVHTEWYYGDHEIIGEGYTYGDKDTVKAIVLR
jgi:hypothetical protein